MCYLICSCGDAGKKKGNEAKGGGTRIFDLLVWWCWWGKRKAGFSRFECQWGFFSGWQGLKSLRFARIGTGIRVKRVGLAGIDKSPYIISPIDVIVGFAAENWRFGTFKIHSSERKTPSRQFSGILRWSKKFFGTCWQNFYCRVCLPSTGCYWVENDLRASGASLLYHNQHRASAFPVVLFGPWHMRPTWFQLEYIKENFKLIVWGSAKF